MPVQKKSKTVIKIETEEQQESSVRAEEPSNPQKKKKKKSKTLIKTETEEQQPSNVQEDAEEPSNLQKKKKKKKKEKKQSVELLEDN